MIKLNRITPLFFFIYISLNGKCQDLDNIVELHQQNLRELLSNRGVDAWVDGDVNEYDIFRSLDGYKRNVAALIYSHTNDTLTINLVKKNGEVLTSKHYIMAESLTQQVKEASLWFSGHNNNVSKRGAAEVEFSVKKSELAFEELNEILLPFKDTLQSVEHLIIVPSLNISTLPFAAFKLSPNEYLVDRMSYSIAPSLFELMVSQQINRNRGIGPNQEVSYVFTNALFVANPTFPKDNNRFFQDLPGTVKEVDKITANMPPSTFVMLKGNDATRNNVLKDICEYDLLYFATHGISNSQNPLDSSFLVFGDSLSENAFLTARTIQDLRLTCRLKADLVVLSACQTGLGQEHSGGIIGIARAFQIAGANHVLMSLWNINDEETARLMSFFFGYLQTGSDMMPHEALRQAMLRYKKEVNANPNYWAAFSILGLPY